MLQLVLLLLSDLLADHLPHPGWYGLGAAKQFHCLNPGRSLVVLEQDASIGGTWSDHRIYPGLKSNNLLGTYEYPDFPMNSKTFGVEKNQYIPGGVLNAYLKAYAAKFGITDLIRFNSKATVAEHLETEGGWKLTIHNSKTSSESSLYARHLIVATGLTSAAFLPHFDGQETFGGKVFHGKDLLKNAETIEKGKTITVLGGSKSSWDAVYAYASAGAKVNWIIRSSGHGPCWMSPSYVTPLKRWIEELANTRFLTWFSPCIWSHASGYNVVRKFLHGTAIGRAIVNGFWAVLGGDVMALNKYDAHPDTAKLKPWTHAMFTGPTFSILNYDSNIFDLVKSDLVNVHIGEIDHLSPGKVHLADGTALESDCLLANTGWKHVPAMRFLPEGIEKELGIPHTQPKHDTDIDLGSYGPLLEKADGEIFERYPRLKDQPVWNQDYVPLTEQKGISSDDKASPAKPLTPFMLHRFVIPASERFLKHRDIAFAGFLSNFSNPINAHLQGLWISAYFQGRILNDPAAALDDTEAMTKLQYETVLHNRFGQWRYPTDWRAPATIFDAVPYIDMILSDLGLKTHRKSSALVEIFGHYGPSDYRTTNDEWLELSGKGSVSK
jgi:cation diffusion facilitator CzcD-associated flavoprotein CzcO